jgi:hypothetical protein
MIIVSLKRVKKDWWICRADKAAFFGRSMGEVMLKYCRWRLNQYVAAIRPARVADKVMTRIGQALPAGPQQ